METEVITVWNGDNCGEYDGGVIQHFDGNAEAITDSVYSDRLYGWNYDKYNEACMRVWGNTGQGFYSNRTPDQVEKFLQIYTGDDSIRLHRILRFENYSNGYPYWRFDYSKTD